MTNTSTINFSVTINAFAEVEALRTDATTRGVRPGVTFKVPGVDTLPSGVSYNSGTNIVTVSGTGVILDSWNFVNNMVVLDDGSSVDEFVDCAFGYDGVTFDPGTNFAVDKFPTAVVTKMHYCSGFGPAYFNNAVGSNFLRGRTSGSGASASASPITLIERCEFYGFSGDILTTNWGDSTIQYNYFDCPAFLPTGTEIWDTDTVYNTGDWVISSDRARVYQSLVDSNQGNAPPSDKTSDANWQNADPHSDHINTRAQTGSTQPIIQKNYINRDESLRAITPWNGTSNQRAVGINNGIRNNRDSGSTDLHGGIVFKNNIVTGAEPEIRNVSNPISMGPSSDTNLSPSTFTNNKIGPDGGGGYWPGGDEVGHTVSGNTDYVPPATATAGYGGPSIT